MSRPIAWLAYAPDASESSFVTLFREQAETAARDWGWSVEPLFAGLTDAEREAVETAALEADAHQHSRRAQTLRGLLERFSQFAKSESDSPQPIANCDSDSPQPIECTPATPSTPAECAVPPQWTSKPYWVDPPEGWRWGFPRLYDPATDGDMTAWMIRHGYPQRLADQGLACTFTEWTEDGEK